MHHLTLEGKGHGTSLKLHSLVPIPPKWTAPLVPLSRELRLSLWHVRRIHLPIVQGDLLHVSGLNTEPLPRFLSSGSRMTSRTLQASGEWASHHYIALLYHLPVGWKWMLSVSVFSTLFPMLTVFALVAQVVTSSLGVFSLLWPSQVFEGSRLLEKDLQLTDSISPLP